MLAMAMPVFAWLSPGVSAHAAQPTNPPIILTVEGTNVFIQRRAANSWDPAYPNQILGEGDRGRTGRRSRASVRLSDLSVQRVFENSVFEIRPLADPNVEAEFSLFRGLLYLLNRDRPGKHRFITPTATAATRGTEFVLEVEEGTGRTTLTVLEGEAELTNNAGSVRIAPGEQGVALLGQPPIKTAVIDTATLVQWCLYYPGVLDVDELELAPAEQNTVADSLAAYRSGDLLKALSAYPAERAPASDHEKIYLAALLLSVGQVVQAESTLDSLSDAAKPNSTSRRLADALRLVVATVQRRPAPDLLAARASDLSPLLATELLARSYHLQSRHELRDALQSAQLSVKRAPKFAFGWTRVAELEFAHGRTRPALDALETSVALAPRNAQSLALKGFLLAAQNRISAAIEIFDQAIELDGGLGNAWLGRGLCRIRQGRAEEGRFDLQVAATAEPQRSLLRSYLGKAFSNAGDAPHAEKELNLAKEIDAGDPTPWLYSALLLQQQNRINDGIQDLQRSRELNENRALYRGGLLLDQDRAVRGANLANLYRDAGMTDVSVREAARAVNTDYANYSAHLFLANSFNELRDPRRVNQRYETPWFNEYLVGNLLAPVGGGALSQSVSQQEYSKLFEQDRFGVASRTTYYSHGRWLQDAAQFGTVRNLSYAAEAYYDSDDGWRPNNDWEQFTAALTLKYQITPADSIYVRTLYETVESGDPAQYYRQSEANPGLRLRERQEPLVLAGYHHEWSPGNHTLLLAARLNDTLLSENPSQSTYFLDRGLGGPVREVIPASFDRDYRNELESYVAELQQLLQRGDHTLVIGARAETGEMHTRSAQTDGSIFTGTSTLLIPFASSQNLRQDFDRQTAYLYEHWQLWPTLTLIGGASYDRVHFPENFRYAPLSNGSDTRDQVSPKAGLVFTPFKETTVRAAWFRGLGGVSLGQSVRLEPSQVAGFNQSFRSLIPESIDGDAVAPVFDAWALSVEKQFGRSTYLGLGGEILSSQVDRQIGVVDFSAAGSGFSAAQTRETLGFRERTLTATFNQLLGEEWSVGARYRLSKADLDKNRPQLPAPNDAIYRAGLQREQAEEAVLHQLQFQAIYNHASGFFGGASALWNLQSNQGYAIDRPGDDFWQFNIEAGWRFFRRRLEARAALLNLADQDYRLNPLNLTSDLPRERELVLTLRFNF